MSQRLLGSSRASVVFLLSALCLSLCCVLALSPRAALASPTEGYLSPDASRNTRDAVPPKTRDAVAIATFGARANLKCPDFEWEPNENFGAATLLSIGIPYQAYICDASDLDFFSFDIPDNYHINTYLAMLPIDVDLYLFNPDGIEIGSSTNDGTTEEMIDYDAIKGGRYVILAQGRKGAFDADNPYTFALDAWYVAPATETPTPTEIPKDTPTPTPTATETCPDAYEPNDSFGDAWPIGPGDYVSYICDTLDQDWFQFTVQLHDTVELVLTSLPGNYDLYVYDGSYSEVGRSENPGTADEHVVITDAKVAGQYRVLVASKTDYSRTSPYKLGLSVAAGATPTATVIEPSPTRTATPTWTTQPSPTHTAVPSWTAVVPSPTPTATGTQTCPDPYELNDTFESPIPIEPGDLLSYICEPTDQDYFVFTVQLHDTVELRLTQLPGDYDLYVFDGAHNEQGRSVHSGTTDEYVLVSDAKVAGDYRVLVVSKVDFSRTVPYKLNLHITHGGTATPTHTPTLPACNTDPSEPNDTFATAHVIWPGGWTQGYICPPGDTDFFKFAVNANYTIRLELRSLPADYDLYLWSPAGVQVAYSRNGITYTESITYVAMATGDYRAEVRPVYGQWHATDPYDLRPDLYAPTPTATHTRTRTATPTRTPWPTVTPTSTPPPDLDLSILSMEVNQAVQPMFGDGLAPVWGKPTVVRLYVTCGPRYGILAEHVTARIVIRDIGGAYQTTLTPFNPGQETGVWSQRASEFNWEHLNTTLNFEVPSYYLKGRWMFEITVNPDHTVPETNYENNTIRDVVEFQILDKGMSIAWVPIDYNPINSLQPYTGAHLPTDRIADRAGYLKATWPVRNDRINYFPAMTGPLVWNNTVGGFLSYWHLVLALTGLWDDMRPQPDHLVGWLPSDAYVDSGPTIGFSTIPLWGGLTEPHHALWCEDRDNGEVTMAHELLHVYGYWHNCDTIGGRGFDMRNRTVRGSAQTQVICATNSGDGAMWADWPTWQEMYNEWWTARPIAASSAETRAISPSRYVSVMGIITPSTSSATTADMFPLEWITRTETSEIPTGDTYCLEFRGSGSVLLQSYCFDGSPGCTESVGPQLVGFHYNLPWPAATTLLQLKEGQTVLAERAASAHLPTVHVLAPNGGEALDGEFEVRWTGNDDDGDPLSYSVLYSPDGGVSWMPLGLDTTGTSIVVSTDDLTGGELAQIRVRVTDGFASGEDASDAPFSVPRKAPMPRIDTPDDSAWFQPTDLVTLEGEAFDPEDGIMPGAKLTWFESTGSGMTGLGTGALLTVGPFPAGDHVIVLDVVDSDGTEASDSVTIHVGEQPATAVYLPVVLKRR